MDGFDILIANKILNSGSSPSPPIPEPVLIEKTVTANDTYNASDDNADGYSSVTVNVPIPPVQIEEFSLGNIIEHYYIDGGTGALSYYDGESATDFLEVDSDHYYAFSGEWGTHGGAWDPSCNARYDANKQYISGFSFSGITWMGFVLLSFGSSVKYIRLSQATELFKQYKTKVYKIPKSAMPPRGT